MVSHHCWNHELKVVLVQERDLTDEEESDLPMKEPSVEMAERVDLSLNSVISLRTPRTMKI